jgi:hypothetical protein
MANDRQKPTWPWIVAVLIALPVLYIASFGPVCWVAASYRMNGDSLSSVYAPVFWTLNHGPSWLRNAADRYVHVGAGEHCGWIENSTGKIVGIRTD